MTVSRRLLDYAEEYARSIGPEGGLVLTMWAELLSRNVHTAAIRKDIGVHTIVHVVHMAVTQRKLGLHSKL